MIRENWRLGLLLVLIVASGAALFVPGAVGGGGEGVTNLQYGLQLSGGTQLDTLATGVTATDVDVTTDTAGQVEREVAGALDNVSGSDVRADAQSETVEVYANISAAELGTALDDAEIDYGSTRTGVTEETRTTIVDTLDSKVNTAGFGGGQVTTMEVGDQVYIQIEVPNVNASEVQRLIADRGRVVVYAMHPTSDGPNASYADPLILEQEDYERPVESPEQTQDGPAVPLQLTEEAARNFSDSMERFGFLDAAIESGQAGQTCYYRERPEDPGHCMITELDGEVVYSAGMSSGLAQDIRSDAFIQDRSFVITANNMSQARELQINLQAGALPAPLSIESRYSVGPSFAEETRTNSFLAGLIAVIAVSFVVYLRYGAVKVAAPMVVTALSEVLILLGFAAGIGLPLDLSHIAGLIAVIGTGVDDLVIIADEVMTEQVSSNRVFRSRFRKALWVIGAAAVTTIIAMSPLAAPQLSLGDLRGFALITILGVLVGVLITRPAYGDILRKLLTGD